MCVISGSRSNPGLPPENGSTTCFICTRLNPSTFLIIEDDKWGEEPYIYAKIFHSSIVLIDTGCGGAAKNEAAELTSLRKFIETYPIPDNDNKPLNEGSKKSYVVICTHCHFDHIGATEQFMDAKSTIWASSYDKSFLETEKLSTTSLCRFVAMETPKYTVGQWADDGMNVSFDGKDLDLVIYHTPGHTPDQVAIWDSQERVIFVGDTMYEWAHILFPIEGSIHLYSQTLEKLKGLIQGWNSKGVDSVEPSRAKMACGHNTRAADAEVLVDEVDTVLYRIMDRQLEEKDRGNERDELQVSYHREDRKINFFGPKKFFDEFRSNEKAMKLLRERHKTK